MERGSGGGGRREREKLRGSGGLLWGGKEVWGQREGVVGWKKRGKRLLWVEGKTAGGVERCGGKLRELTGGGNGASVGQKGESGSGQGGCVWGKKGEWGLYSEEKGPGVGEGVAGGSWGVVRGFYGVERESGGDLGGFWSGKGGMGSLRC